MDSLIEYIRDRDSDLLDAAVTEARRICEVVASSGEKPVLPDVLLGYLEDEETNLTYKDMALRIVAAHDLEQRRRDFLPTLNANRTLFNGLGPKLGRPLPRAAKQEDAIALYDALTEAQNILSHAERVERVELRRQQAVDRHPKVIEALNPDRQAMLIQPISLDTSNPQIDKVEHLLNRVDELAERISGGAEGVELEAAQLIADFPEVMEEFDGDEAITLMVPLDPSSDVNAILAKLDVIVKFRAAVSRQMAFDEQINQIQEELEEALSSREHALSQIGQKYWSLFRSGAKAWVSDRLREGESRTEALSGLKRLAPNAIAALTKKAEWLDRQAEEGTRIRQTTNGSTTRRRDPGRRARQIQTSQAGPAKGKNPAPPKPGGVKKK